MPTPATDMYTNFEWPTPHLYQPAASAGLDAHEPATIRLLNGTQLEGMLTRFLPSHGVVELMPNKERANISVPLTDIEQLRLDRPLILKRRTDIMEIERRGDMVRPSEQQSVALEFINGNTLAVETAGFDMQEAGMFLFVAGADGSFIRTFVPASAIRKEQIGPLIGKTLIEQKVITNGDVEQALRAQQQLRTQKLGDILAEQKVISREQLHAALEHKHSLPVERLGDVLIGLKLITAEQLNSALELQRENRDKPLGEILLTLGLVSREQLYRGLSEKLGIPIVDLAKFNVDPAVLKLLSDDLVSKYQVMPLCMDNGALVVAMANPLDPDPLERVRFFTQAPVVPVLATVSDIQQAIKSYYAVTFTGKNVEEIADELRAEAAPEPETTEETINETDNTLVRLINKMIIDAHASGASDIHVEANPGKTSVLIRFRKDGVLTEYLRLPHSFRRAAVSRLKIMANIDISEHRRAQDGRINFREFGPANVELRVVVVPTQDGLENVVMRLLTMSEPMPITKLGLREPVLAEMRKLLERPHGLILAVGPTGSGKTTTLHSLISVLNVPGVKIWTAENPIEITQPGLCQVQVNPRIGWDFATVMRAFLRADPDVIMIGEMRDQETAGIGIEASLTGHLVFSTLHTNSAAETVVRLLDMGIDPFSFSDSLVCVLAQRLARRLCPKCVTSRAALDTEVKALAEEYCYDTLLQPAQVIEEWHKTHGNALSIYEGHGCENCRNSGYRGRVGLHELLVATPKLREMMLRRATASELKVEAMQSGMRTLKQDGIEKCLAGYTDIHEIRATAT
jgi:type II secretory ATPase GspE/PulE/Tfp pilus assembly ATPase PilB-like protein